MATSPSDAPMTAPDADSVSAFAADLRSLRLRTGNPTLLALAGLTGISKSVLSDALAGRRLPTEKTTALLTEALGEDPAPWVGRRAHLLADATTALRRPAPSAGAPRTTSVRRLVTAIVVTALVSVSVTSAGWAAALLPLVSGATAATAATPSSPASPPGDGVDPMQTVCRDDAVIAASEQRLDGAVQVQMMYSTSCMAAWGRVTRYDGQANGQMLAMRVYPAIDPESSRAQERSAFDLQSLYTPLLIEPDVNARVCGLASVSQSGATIELGPPLCI